MPSSKKKAGRKAKPEHATPETTPQAPAENGTAPYLTVYQGEIDTLAAEMAERHARYVEYLMRSYKETGEEAIARAGQDARSEEERVKQLEETPLRHLAWHDFDGIAEFDMEAALRKWGEVKEKAREEFEHGQHNIPAMRLMGPWQRAQFGAIRQSFIDEWQPRGGAELALVDQMAQAFMGYLSYMEHFNQMGEITVRDGTGRRHPQDPEVFNTPRVTRAEYIESQFRMVERFQRMFLRCLRALRDLRRYAPKITIHNQGQVNIGQNQVNQARKG